MNLRMTLFALFTLFSLASYGIYATDQKDRDNIALHFAWPTGTNGTVNYQWDRQQSSMGYQQRERIKGGYSLKSSPTTGGQLISFSDSQMTLEVEGGQKVAGETANLKEFIARVGNLKPDFKVSDKGAMLSIENLDKYKQELTAAAEEWAKKKSNQAMRDRAMQLVQVLATQENLQGGLSSEWTQLVGQWSGQTMKIGKTYKLATWKPMVKIQNQMAPVIIERVLHGRVPCYAPQREAKCVELEVLEAIDEVRYDAWLKDFQSHPERSYTLLDLKMENRYTLITEPDTLLPYHLRVTSSEGIRTLANNFESELRTKSTMKTEYHYNKK